VKRPDAASLDAHAGRFAAALVAAGDLPLTPTSADVEAAIRRRMACPMTAIPLLRTGWEEPAHLVEMNDVYVRAEAAANGDGPPVLATFSAPSQVGKSSFGEVADAWWLARNPSHHLGSLLYGQDLANDQSRRIRDDVIALGVPLRGDSSAIDHWTTTAGGGLLSRGLMGGITGQPGLARVRIDDPYRNRMEAESVAHRKRVNDTLKATVFTRRNPRTSILIQHTRWAPDDLIGFVEKEYGARFEHYRVPAVDDAGHAVVRLAGRDDAFWAEQRVLMGEHDWWSLMMGLPRPREGTLFKSTFGTYRELPERFDAICIGLDFAYSVKTKADHSAAVAVGRAGAFWYVLAVVRRQCAAPDFASDIRAMKMRYPTATLRAYIGGTELGTVDFLNRPPHSLRIGAITTRADKYARAQPCAAAWNRGAVLLPEHAPWLDVFIGEVLDFNGEDGGRDDQTDSMVGGFDGCGPPTRSSATPIGDGGAREHRREFTGNGV
jgi:predicted phage terminase large subunit-like protein